MAKKSLLLYLLTALVIVQFNISCIHKSRVQNNKEKFIKYVETQMEPYRELYGENKPGIQFATYGKEGSAYYQYGFGPTVNENWHIRGASTTKTSTAAAILLLHQRGLLNIDDKLTDKMPGKAEGYLPNNALFDIPYKSAITIRLLLNHRAGVFDVTNSNMPDSLNAPYAGQRYTDYLSDLKGETYAFDVRELIEPVAKHQLNYFEPNASMHYSNTGYHLLSVIVERVSGLPLHEFKTKEFIVPFKLSETTFDMSGKGYVPEPAIPCYLRINDSEVISGDFDNLSLAQADGNITTTVHDLAKWAYYLWGTNEILNADLLAQMTDGLETGEFNHIYGLGCGMHPPDIGHGHDGVRKAFMTIMRYHPPTNKSYVVMTNSLNIEDMFGQAEILSNIMRKGIELDL